MLIHSLLVMSTIISLTVDDYCLAFCKGQSLDIAQAKSNDEIAYQGAFLCMKAEEVLSPFDKYAYFKDGTKLIDRAVANDAEAFHPRFVRFVIQSKTPAFLMYKDKLEEDQAFLQDYIEKHPQQFNSKIGLEITRVCKELNLFQ